MDRLVAAEAEVGWEVWIHQAHALSSSCTKLPQGVVPHTPQTFTDIM